LVSAIIPARNEEASVERAVESVAAQAEVGEVIVVNDQSTDGTGAILAGVAARIPKVKVMETGELPTGWVGKNYAVAVGAAAAEGEWLLFTDADTYHYPGSAKKALADAAKHEAALVSYSPEQEMETFWERALIPFVFWRLSRLYDFGRVNDASKPDAAANGQYLMIAREAYEAVGGHAAIAGQVLEDVALARCVKQAGYRLYFAGGRGIVRTRMYRSFRAMWEGWTKNLFALLDYSELALLREMTDGIILGVIVVLAAGWAYEPRGWIALAAGSAVLGARMMGFATYLRENRYPGAYIQYVVPAVCLYSATLLASWWRYKRGRIEWKGRTYPARDSNGAVGGRAQA
jgi:glycosyltransferase involved in cell wall biosynthesis